MLSLLPFFIYLATAASRGSLPTLNARDSLGPIGTDSPTGITGGQIACAAPPVSSFFMGFDPPFPTNLWWAPYAAPPGNATAAGPFPYQSSLDGEGFVFGFGTDRQFDGTSIKQPSQKDWRVGFTEHSGKFSNHKATAWDTQTVTLQYFENDVSMTVYGVPGSPYITFQFNQSTPILTAMNGGIQSFNSKSLLNGGNVTAYNTEFTVTDTKNATYIIYSLTPITLTASSTAGSSGTIAASEAFTGVLRVVKLEDPIHKTILDEHYQIYPVSVGQTYGLSNTIGTVSFRWNTVGNGDNLLMLTWPHHRLAMQNGNFPDMTTLSYMTTKGHMYPALGNEWQLAYNLTTIIWDPPRKLDSSCSSAVIQGLEYEVGQLDPAKAPIPGDFYYWGGSMNAVARLAVIADNLGRTDLIPPVIKYLEASFDQWFNSTATTMAAYETAWGGVINKAGANNSWVDFGNGYYNDHHFHYGYFLAVAAVIAKYDQGWLNQHKSFISWFARDIINPSTEDPYFPITRCRDWFAGHSWASGIANGAGSRDQESTGEAVNGYYGALLWASVALSEDMVNYAKLLLATEMQGAQVYWHLYPNQASTDPNNPYPEQGLRDLVTIGNVEDWQAGAWLFWGSQKSEIAAIQILPVQPVNEILYDAEWVKDVWEYTMVELIDPSIGDEWKSVIIDAYSNINPQVAAQWSANITSWGSGQTYTNELFFIGTRPNPSGVPICGKDTLPSNPYGKFLIQDASSGRYVAASSANSNLIASAADISGAATFNSSFVPNSGTLQLMSTREFVTADQSGNFTLSATRSIPSSWETFVIRQKIGAAAGVYSIKAASNGLYVTISGDGSLINNGKNEAASSGFKFSNS